MQLIVSLLVFVVLVSLKLSPNCLQCPALHRTTSSVFFLACQASENLVLTSVLVSVCRAELVTLANWLTPHWDSSCAHAT